MLDFVAFDLETTGIQPLEDAIVEIGAVKFIDGLPQKDFCQLVNPRCEIPADAIRVHGLSNEEVRNQPDIQDVMLPGTRRTGAGYLRFGKKSVSGHA
jgi:DNA polymerase-3 subunit epsilon